MTAYRRQKPPVTLDDAPEGHWGGQDCGFWDIRDIRGCVALALMWLMYLCLIHIHILMSGGGYINSPLRVWVCGGYINPPLRVWVCVGYINPPLRVRGEMAQMPLVCAKG